ncbi:MAG: NYN domain-containing protein [Patescibacteria group bacterium]
MPVIKHPSQRVGIFIDVQNLYHSAKNLYKTKVNFKEVLNTAVAGRQLVRAIGYVISTESGEERIFFDALTKLGIETKEKELQIFFGGLKKADWDVAIAVDALRLAPSLDTVVLCSGDGDFAPLVEQLQSMGKQVEIIAFSKSASSKLQEACDDFVDLCEKPEKYLFGKKRR